MRAFFARNSDASGGRLSGLFRVAGSWSFGSLIVLGVLFAGSPVNQASRTESIVPKTEANQEVPLLTEETVRSWVAGWQRRLGLDEWKIESKIVRSWDLPRGAVANIHWSLPRKSATIKVLSPLDSTLRRSEIARDTELSVIHELVHLSMAKLPLDPNHTELEEEAVKKLSVALIKLQEQTALAQDVTSLR